MQNLCYGRADHGQVAAGVAAPVVTASCGRQPCPSISEKDRHLHHSDHRPQSKQRLQPSLTVCFPPAFTTFGQVGFGPGAIWTFQPRELLPGLTLATRSGSMAGGFVPTARFQALRAGA